MIRINLLPVRVSKKKVAGKQQLLLLALIVVFAVIANWVWASSRAGDLATRESKVKRTQDEIAQLDRIIGEVKNIKAQQAALQEKLDVLDKLKAGRSGPVKLLDELARSCRPASRSGRWTRRAGPSSSTARRATIDDVSAFMTALKQTPYFSKVELKKTTAATRGGMRIVDFTVTAQANYTPGASARAAPAKR